MKKIILLLSLFFISVVSANATYINIDTLQSYFAGSYPVWWGNSEAYFSYSSSIQHTIDYYYYYDWVNYIQMNNTNYKDYNECNSFTFENNHEDMMNGWDWMITFDCPSVPTDFLPLSAVFYSDWVGDGLVANSPIITLVNNTGSWAIVNAKDITTWSIGYIIYFIISLSLIWIVIFWVKKFLVKNKKIKWKK